MAEPAPRRPRRWWRRRKAMPLSRRTLGLTGLLIALLLVVLLVAAYRARPGTEVPPYRPPTTTTVPDGPVPLPVITAVATVPAPPASAPARRSTTTRRHR